MSPGAERIGQNWMILMKLARTSRAVLDFFKDSEVNPA